MLYIIILLLIVAICLLVLTVKRCFVKDSATDVATVMFTSGIGLIVSAFPGVKEVIAAIIASFVYVKVSLETETLAIIAGFLLIGLGFVYKRNIMDRIYILNMYGMFSQLDISDIQHVKELNLSDFKVKESIIDIVDVFSHGEMSNEKNEIITNKISKRCSSFRNRSADFKACFTGMAPIPYTMFAGNCLSGGSISRFFEYKRSENKYIELTNKGKSYPSLKIEKNVANKAAQDVLVTISVTMPVLDADVMQFSGYDRVNFKLENTGNNVITNIQQLNNYVTTIVDEIEKLKADYPNLRTVHVAASIPSCLAEQLGEKFMLNSNRLPEIIAYHYDTKQNPKYQFGIVVSGSESGKLVV